MMHEGTAATATNVPRTTPMDALSGEINLLYESAEKLSGIVAHCYEKLYGTYSFAPDPEKDAAEPIGKVASLENDVRSVHRLLKSALEVAASLEEKI